MRALAVVCLLVVVIAGIAVNGSQARAIPGRHPIVAECVPASCAEQSMFAAGGSVDDGWWWDGAFAEAEGDADPDWHLAGTVRAVFDWLRQNFFDGSLTAPDARVADHRLFDLEP